MEDSQREYDQQTEDLLIPKYYFIELGQDGSFPRSNDQLFQIKKSDKLRIILYSRKTFDSIPYLLTNLPKQIKNKKVQNKETLLKMQFPNPIELKSPCNISRADIDKHFTLVEGEINIEGSWVFDLQTEYTGPLFLQIIFVKNDENIDENLNILEIGKPEHILVEPRIIINAKPFRYSQLIIQTILSRSLGPYTRWKEFFKTQSESGYNAFHFAPIQQLGASSSLYSIKNQLKLSEELFPEQNDVEDFNKLKDIVSYIETSCNALSFVDILLNHTSFDSEWLLKSSDSYYNVENTPQLITALMLDQALMKFSDQLANKEIEKYHKGNIIESEDDINWIAQIIWDDVIIPLNIPDYFKADIEVILSEILSEFTNKFPDKNIPLTEEEVTAYFNGNKFEFIQNEFDKLKLNFGISSYGVTYNIAKIIDFIDINFKHFSLEILKNVLQNLNNRYEAMALDFLSQALNNSKGTMRYHILELRNHEITIKNKIVNNYFTILKNGKAACNNGWIINADSLEDFATSPHFHYLRRTIVIWGDLVKLRYGNSKSDSPFLWKHMKEYVRKMASVFHGFRLDNAHSTPLHVGEYLMRKARKVNVDLLIISELFTGNGDIDALFTKKIGFNGLVREAQRCWDTPSLSYTLNHYGQIWKKTVGSIDKFYEVDLKTGEKWYSLAPTCPEGILYDVTHDNKSYYESRTIMDCLSKAALLAFSGCFIGTTKGFDEFFENKINVVDERRLYKTHIENFVSEVKDKTIFCRFLFTPKSFGNVEIKGNWNNWSVSHQMILKNHAMNLYEAIIPLWPGNYEYKFIVNGNFALDEFKPTTYDWRRNHYFTIPDKPAKIHQNISCIRGTLNAFQKKLPKNYPEIFVETHGYDIITLLREHKTKLKHYVVIVRNAINHDISPDVDICINLPGVLDSCKHIFWASNKIFEKPHSLKFLLGMAGEVYEEFELRKFCDIFYNPKTEGTVLHFSYMPPSFVCIIKTRVSEIKRTALCTLNNLLETLAPSKKICQNLTPVDINYLMFSCDSEEQELNHAGTFYLPGKGKLNYAGFGSLYTDIKRAAQNNDLGIPIFNSLREGFWILDYFLNRMKKRPNLSKIFSLLEQYFGLLKLIPKHDIPNYFSKIYLYIIRGIHHKIFENLKIQNPYMLASKFNRNLLLASYQFISNVPSGTPPNYSYSMAAGLPHFSTGWSRVWGRDTFIAFKGILLIPGLYKEAREKILMFASTLRHGILPNLFDKASNPRYNCRDACWWFIKSVKDYMEFTNNEDNILKENIEMRFVDDNQLDDMWKKEKGEKKFMKLADIIQSIFESHAKGIKFQEWNAGDKIDCEMQEGGFQIELYMDEETGFIFGGNQMNCLTWMDKMGSSGNSGNRGWPATPRDGAPIEMTGLLKHCIDFAVKYNSLKLYPYNGVTKKNGKPLLFTDWAEKIKKNFERCYYIPIEKEKDQYYDVNQYAVKRRGIYKDIYKCVKERADYQLRGNACIAIALAPELFTRKYALFYLGWVEEMLIEENSLGLKTLDKEDSEYIPFYNNSDDGYDRRIAKGYSYHQGPEWVWIYGYFLKALIILNNDNQNFQRGILMSYLANHKFFLQNNEWLSLPEMTNANGDFCEFSCPAQAWSISCILEASYDFIKLMASPDPNKKQI